MLFMGTKKYPDENEYSEFIQNNGGYSNAWTSMTSTNFHFDIASDCFEEALDKFAQFFISPLFNESAVEREMMAVESEFTMFVQDDTSRRKMIFQTLAHRESPYHCFDIGSLESLKQDGIRAKLLSFHDRWYSANLMNLVVLGNHPIETMEKWVYTMFGPIINKEVARPDHSKPCPPFTSANLGQLARFKPIKDKHTLEVTWVLPYCELEIKSKPIKYFSHLFGHESQNSLLGWLKDHGLAMSLSSDFQHEIGVFSYLCLAIVLTEKGLEQVDTVIEAVFKYAQKLRETGPSQYVFDELQRLGELRFAFLDKTNASDYCVDLANSMTFFKDQESLKEIIRH